MNNEINMTISIPTDNEGYVLLKCPCCGSFFKAMPQDINDEGILSIFCPSCGLSSTSYVTDEVLDLAQAMAKNKATDLIYKELKKLERQFGAGAVSFRAGKPPKPEPESPLKTGIDVLEVKSFPCCKRTAKVKPLLMITGCYCPFCGVKCYENE